LTKNSVTVQPDGTVTVTIPVPTGYDKTKLAVYYIPDNSDPEKISSKVEGDNIVFNTNHFSVYAIAELSATSGDNDQQQDDNNQQQNDDDKTANETATTGDPAKTGVETHLGLWLALCGVSLLAVAGLVTVQVRKKGK